MEKKQILFEEKNNDKLKKLTKIDTRKTRTDTKQTKTKDKKRTKGNKDTAKKLNISISSERSISISDEENRDETEFSYSKKKDLSNEEDITVYLNQSDKIYCRENEKECIKSFLSDNNKKGLYISGQPGTGKTCLVTKIVNDYKKTQKNMFDIYINCFCFHTFDEFYNNIFQNLEENKKQILKLLKPEHCIIFKSFLQKRSSATVMRNFLIEILNEINLSLVLILDEVDFIYKNKLSETEAYDLIKIPYLVNSHVKLLSKINTNIVISNNTEFEYKIFPEIEDRKYKVDKFIFRPYSYQEILTILSSKLEEMNLTNKFSKECLIFISKKFANKVGDLRPALEICKSVILDHLKELKNEGFSISLKEIIMKINKTNNSFTELLSNLTLEQKIVIASIYLILSKSKKTEFSETEVYQKYVEMKKDINGEFNITDFKEILKNVNDYGIIKAKSKKNSQIFNANYNENELEIIFSEDSIFKFYKNNENN